MNEAALVSDSLLLGVAVVVFVLMLIGLVLTVTEFNYGQPKREAEEPGGSGARGVRDAKV